MKLKLLIATSILFSVYSLNANEKGKELFLQKCAICHFEKVPSDKSTVVAPPAPGLMFHMKEIFSTNEQIKNHMTTFTLNPSVQNAKLKGAVRRFGLMPSQKDQISEDELKLVVEYIIHNFGMTAAEHNANQKKHRQQ